MKTIPFQKLKDEWVKDASFRMEYQRLKPKYLQAITRTRNRGVRRENDRSAPAREKFLSG